MMSLSHGFELGRKQGFRQITTAKVENAQHDNLRLMTPVVFDKSDGWVAKEPPTRREEALEHANKQLQIENEKRKLWWDSSLDPIFFSLHVMLWIDNFSTSLRD